MRIDEQPEIGESRPERRPTPGPPNRLPAPERLRLALEILGTYVKVRLLVGRRELPRLVAELRVRPAPRSAERVFPDGHRDGLRLGRAVTRMLSALPMDARCLVRSLVLLRLLVRRDADGALIIGVLPTDGRELIAHAWIELDGRPLLDPGEDEFGRLLSL
jgi:hypothetical protein